jgi:putative transposase
VVSPAAKREAVSELRREHAVGIRRSCGLMGLTASSYSYRPAPGRVDAPGREALRQVAARRQRWWHRMLTLALRREGFPDITKRNYRIHREEKLQVQVRRKRNRNLWRDEKRLAPQAANERGSMDFMSDQLADGRKSRMLNVVDTLTRECLAIEVDSSCSGQRVTWALGQLVALRGNTKRLLTDNETEFAGKALARWADEHCVEHKFI